MVFPTHSAHSTDCPPFSSLKIKNKFCPDCPNAFTDPGSLTRHRKRRHNYVPEPRKARSKVAKASVSTPSSTASRLPSLSPPPRGLSVESTATDRTGYTSESTGSHSSQESSDREFDFHVYTVLTPEFPSYLAPSMTSKSCVIKNEQVSEAEPTICYSKFVDTLKERTPSPKPLLPAVEAGTSLGDLSYQELLRLLSPEPEVLMLECEAPKPQYNVGALVAPVAQYPQQQQVLSNAELFHQTKDEVDWSWMDDQVFQSNCTGITEQYDNNNIDAYSFDGFATGPVSPSLDFASTPLFEASPSYADEYSTVIPPMTEEEEQLLEQILSLSNQ